MYQDLIVGRPVLPPRWALGWHQCKYCLRDEAAYREVVDSYRVNGIPLDAQWADIDYMDRYRDFSVDPVSFGNLSHYIDDKYHH
jgi:alpha-glucosidase (family GH31 glycosyl hydrolase)